ncbi:hypothetical protein [Frondihabitans australicus]|uniref:Uncharacterized protein n=1 Tax=Frondihabitans australicus TaxID=386892 RepID=A0A495IEJ6_9MICO|nr:hypothetical protein [Frondihabitans australicus]RKR74199.1 hypothetical protein C8E83_1307 [Frondihabitans australicus]
MSGAAPAEQQERAGRRILLLLVATIALPVAGSVVGLLLLIGLRGGLSLGGVLFGSVAIVFAVPFAISAVVNLMLWVRRPAGTTAGRSFVVAWSALAVSGAAWIAEMLLVPLDDQEGFGFVIGCLIAASSIAVCVMLVRSGRHALVNLPPEERLARHSAHRRKVRRGLLVTGIAAVALVAAGAFVYTVPTGHYDHCRAEGYSATGDQYTVYTENCGVFAVTADNHIYSSFDGDETCTFTTRGFTILPWRARAVSMTWTE